MKRITLAPGVIVVIGTKHRRFIDWFERSGLRDEESASRGFDYGYRLGYEAAKRRAHPTPAEPT